MLEIEIFNKDDYIKILEIQKYNMEKYTMLHFWTNWTEDRFKNRYYEILDKWLIYSIKLNL